MYKFIIICQMIIIACLVVLLNVSFVEGTTIGLLSFVMGCTIANIATNLDKLQ